MLADKPQMFVLDEALWADMETNCTFTQGDLSCQTHPINRVRPTNKLKPDIAAFFLRCGSRLT